METTGPAVMRLAVIGAGAGGLVVCRHFSAAEQFVVTVFEQTDEIGGTWVYTDQTGTDANGLPIHSSMYKLLLTNLPKEAMGFLDYCFPDDDAVRSFVPHTLVLKYLQDYCHHFELLPYIRFNSLVLKVMPIRSGGSLIWEISCQNVLTKVKESFLFDAVAVCNGHYSVPIYPCIEGLTSFEGTLLHSHDYRIPNPFAGHTVAVLGAGPSGLDIALEVASCAKEVLLCHKLLHPIPPPLPANLRQAPWVNSCDTRGVQLEDGEYSVVDSLILCTGYEYAFPFLMPECEVRVVDRRVTPLYKHFLHSKYPSMAIFGIPFGVLPLPLMDIQARIFLKVLRGSLKLPSEDEMNADTRVELEEFLESGKAPRHFHRMGCDRFERHVSDLTQMAELDPFPVAIHKLYKKSWLARMQTLLQYRNINYRISKQEVFVRDLTQ